MSTRFDWPMLAKIPGKFTTLTIIVRVVAFFNQQKGSLSDNNNN